MWNKKSPITTPQQRHIHTGSIPIVHTDFGTTIALVLPQSNTQATQTVADIIERAPEIIRAVRELDLLTHTPRGGSPDISIANAWRRVRTAMGGLDIHTPQNREVL